MNRVARPLLQVATYLGFVLLVAYLSASPAYDYAAADKATIKLSLSHATNRVEPCVRLTPQQVADLPPNMRRKEQCERERLPLVVRLEIDGGRVAQIEASPSGLWSDGPASIYQRIEVDPGTHVITVSLRDSDRENGWDYTRTEEVALLPGRYFTIRFRAEAGGFIYR
jgi:hypothetical protein